MMPPGSVPEASRSAVSASVSVMMADAIIVLSGSVTLSLIPAMATPGAFSVYVVT